MINLVDWNDSVASDSGSGSTGSRSRNTITAENVQSFPSFQSAGLNLREPREGPEYDLVREYVASYLPCPPCGQTLTVFIEPEIESGFPDVVAVYWEYASARRWPAARGSLKRTDFCLAQFLATMGPTPGDRLRAFFPASPRKSLERLLAAGIVRETCSTWALNDLQEVFAVRRLVAIEAKVFDWQKGLNQATQNTWFASESYLLLPRVPRGAAVLEQAARLGVEVRVRDQSIDGLEPTRSEVMPRSYASWLFNEWAWRAAMRE